MKPTAIIVDDSKVIRRALKLALEKAGYAVVAEGETGTQAPALYEQLRPDLVMLDIVLPGITGIEAAGQILRQFPDACIVMCSSLNAREKILECRSLGVRHFILKPFTIDKVVPMVRALLAGPQAAELAPAAAAV